MAAFFKLSDVPLLQYGLIMADPPWTFKNWSAAGEGKNAKNVRSVIEGPVREHSRKPDEAFEAAESLCPCVKRIELFSRQERPGWDVMGDEVGKFEAMAS